MHKQKLMVLNSGKSNTGFLKHNQPLIFMIGLMLSVSTITAGSYSQLTAIAQSQPSGQPNPNAPLSFFLKLGNNQSTSAASSQAASNGTGTKNITVTVNVQKGGSGNPIKLPISAVVPKNVNSQDLQLCASLANGQQKCQPLTQNAANIDLSSSSGAATTTPQAYRDDSNPNNILGTLSNQIIQYADAQLISVNNTTLNIPITVIVPITLEIQNAQICASVASSGSTSCQQIVLNPTQSAFTPVNVDLSNPTTPTVTTLSASIPTTQLATPNVATSSLTGTNATSGGTNSTSGGTNATSGGTNATSGGTNATGGGGTNASSTSGSQGSQTPSNPTQNAQQKAPEQSQNKIPSNPTEKAQEKNSGSDKSNSKSGNGN